MPDFLERKLEREAEAKGKSGRQEDAYVYGTMNNMGAMHGNKITAKGRRMEREHADKTKKKRQPGARLRLSSLT